MLHMHEVIGSSPITSTKIKDALRCVFYLVCEVSARTPSVEARIKGIYAGFKAGA